MRICKIQLEFFGLPVFSSFNRGGNCVAWLSASAISIQCNPLSFQRAVSALSVIQQLIRMWDASQRQSWNEFGTRVSLIMDIIAARTRSSKSMLQTSAFVCAICYTLWFRCALLKPSEWRHFFALAGAEQALRTPNWCVRSLEMELVELYGTVWWTAQSTAMNCGMFWSGQLIPVFFLTAISSHS